jgi:hypothetical protein
MVNLFFWTVICQDDREMDKEFSRAKRVGMLA